MNYTRTIITMLLWVCCVSGKAQEYLTKSELSLKNRQYGAHHYRVLHQYELDSPKRIAVVKDDRVIASLRLPVADDEAKNFGVNRIIEIDDGFKIMASWGGGNYFYDNIYYFVYKNGKFYLRDIDWSLYVREAEETESYHKKMQPPVEMSKVDLLKYLWKD